MARRNRKLKSRKSIRKLWHRRVRVHLRSYLAGGAFDDAAGPFLAEVV